MTLIIVFGAIFYIKNWKVITGYKNLYLDMLEEIKLDDVLFDKLIIY